MFLFHPLRIPKQAVFTTKCPANADISPTYKTYSKNINQSPFFFKFFSVFIVKAFFGHACYHPIEYAVQVLFEDFFYSLDWTTSALLIDLFISRRLGEHSEGHGDTGLSVF